MKSCLSKYSIINYEPSYKGYKLPINHGGFFHAQISPISPLFIMEVLTMNADAKSRLTQEIKTMSRCFPQFKLFEGDGSYSFAPRGTSFWGGRIQTNFNTEYSLAVVYPPNYPHGAIKAFVTIYRKRLR